MKANSPFARVFMALALSLPAARAGLAQAYHTYPQIEATLLAAQTAHPAICRRVPLGTTIQGRTIWAMHIGDNLDLEEDEPEFRYISSLHGDEIVGEEMCLYLVDHLTSQYGVDPRVTRLVDSVDIWIVPCANPDGFVAGTRGNAHGVDLNRNFPCPYTSPDNTITGRETETAVFMNFAFSRSFVESANFHSGTLVVNYPFDANQSGAYVDTPSPDDDYFEWASAEYSRYNLPMWNSSTFYHGITNGADWYVIYGGHQDWNYDFMGCNDVTIELANSTPPASQLPTWWNNNRDSMLAYMETCLTGVRGIVTDAETGAALAATISVVGRSHNIFSDPRVGDYHRLLLPGSYQLRFEAAGHDPLVLPVIVAGGDATRLDVSLGRPAQVIAPNGGETVQRARPAEITWTGPANAAFDVETSANYGQTQGLDDGFESGRIGPEYSSGGNLPWTVTSSGPHTGTNCARAGAITHSQTSALTRSVSGPGSVAFWYKVSSESGYDFFSFTIDGAAKISRSGTAAWTSTSFPLAAGTHTLTWTYSKDGSASSGSDTAWIDDLHIVADATAWTPLSRTEPDTFACSWTPGDQAQSAKVRVRAVYSGGLTGNWDESDAVFQVGPLLCPADVDGDGEVGLSDLATLLGHFGLGAGMTHADGDVDENGGVDLADLALLLAQFGGNCP